MRRLWHYIAILLTTGAFTSRLAAAGTFDLANYARVATYSLPTATASEASAITFDRQRNSLFVIGDGATSILEISRTGVVLGSMSITGFEDTEGITSIGGGQFVVADERIQDLFRLTYTAGGTVARSTLPRVSLGPTVGNEGIEGVSYESSTQSYFAVKEKNPMDVLRATVNFTSGAATTSSLFNPASLGVTDLADVQVLSNSLAFGGSSDAGNLLLISQESSRLLEVSRAGAVLSSLSLSSLATQAEGVTIDDDGWIYVVDESPRMFVFKPIKRLIDKPTSAPLVVVAPESPGVTLIPVPEPALLMIWPFLGLALRRRGMERAGARFTGRLMNAKTPQHGEALRGFAILPLPGGALTLSDA